uniref:Gag-pol polyprotein n=1 Tax=Solanum tuberosum TaxID=4113 RepID=M1DUV7_SOLTU
MNPPSFTGSSTTEDSENFIEELKKVFEVIHVADTERVELAKYQLNNVARTWFDQWKEGRAEDTPPKQKGHASSSASAPAPKNKGEHNSQNFRAKPAYFQGSMAQGGSKPPACAKCGRNHSVSPPDRVAPRGATSGTGGGTNLLYAINSREEQENLLDVVTGMIQVFDFTIYALLDPGASLSFVNPYVAMNFDVIPEQLSEPFSVSTPVGESILVERVYRDCPISVNHTSWLHACYASVDCRTRVVKF